MEDAERPRLCCDKFLALVTPLITGSPGQQASERDRVQQRQRAVRTQAPPRKVSAILAWCSTARPVCLHLMPTCPS
jgi:hypothetical protein